MRLPEALLASLEGGTLDAYLVAADWLLAHGDPWGELINAQCRLESATDPSAFVTFKKQAEALMRAHRLRWLGADVAAAWKRGFVETVEVDELEVVPRVLASDVGGLAREWRLSGTPRSLQGAVEAIAAAPRLRALGLGLPSPRPSPPRGEGVVVLSGVVLEQLETHGVALDWRFDTARLRSVSVSDVPVVSTFSSELERLELLQTELPHPELSALVDRQRQLRALHLEDDLPDDLARWLAHSPVLKTLDHLALGGPLTDDGLDEVLKAFARFSRLRSIVLYGGRFGATARKWAYKQLPQLTFEKHRPGPGWPGHPRHGIRLSPKAGS